MNANRCRIDHSNSSTWGNLIRVAALFICLAGLAISCATSPDTEMAPEEKWGIKAVSIRLTAADHFVDFRYKITDAEKAMKVLGKNEDAFLIDEKSGKALPVPVTKIGPMRATKYKPQEDKVYVVMFQNVNKMIQRGSRVTVAIGDFRAKDLVVE